MKSFKRHIYKTIFGNFEEEESYETSCVDTIEADGGAGIYEIDIYLGTDVGKAGIRYDAIFFPDRFEIIYDGKVVADSKFVGNGLSIWRNDLLGTKGLFVYKYINGEFVKTIEERMITIQESDISSKGDIGEGVLTFNKDKADVKVMTLRATGTMEATAWTISSICPYQGTLPTAGRAFTLNYDKIRATIDCQNFPDILQTIYTRGEDIAEGVKVYKDIQLMNIPVDGYYKRFDTVYEVRSGVIIDEIICGGIRHLQGDENEILL